MLYKEIIRRYLKELNDELEQADIKGEICLYGGAVMCLAYDARPSTKDVDAVFRPTQFIREFTKKVAKRHRLANDWLNDGVKGFVTQHPYEILFHWSHLKVFIPEADYLLAMKSLSARVDSTDRDDIKFLIHKLALKNHDDVFRILENYNPRQQIKPATQFMDRSYLGGYNSYQGEYCQ